MNKLVALASFAVLFSACSGSGSTPSVPPVAGSTAAFPRAIVYADGNHRTRSSRVTIVEIPVADPPASLAVDQNGAVYFGNAYFASTGRLNRYLNGAFVTTKPYHPPCVHQYDGCVVGGASAITATSNSRVYWTSSMGPFPPSQGGFPITVLNVGGNGGMATLAFGSPPYGSPPISSLYFDWAASVVITTLGDAWLGGYAFDGTAGFQYYGTHGPQFGTYLNNENGALSFVNGPGGTEWAALTEQGLAVPAAAKIFGFRDDGTLLHVVTAPAGAEIGLPAGQPSPPYANVQAIAGVLIARAQYVWFTDAGRNAIARMSYIGLIHEYPIPTPKSGVNGITQSTDGNIWFTETLANKIGRLDPRSGHITEFSLPSPHARPLSIVANPDAPSCGQNVLWVAEFGTSKLAEVTF